MCLALASYAFGKKLTRDEFDSAAKINDDGIGFAFNENGSLFVKKGFESVDLAFEYYQTIPENSSVLVHFRKSSAGSLIPENLHPFTFDNENPNVAWILNGTVKDCVFKDSDKSDCFVLNQIIMENLHKLNPAFYKSFAFKKLIESYIGNAKLAMINNLGEIFIFNESLGTWDDTVNKKTWFSNMLWKKNTVSMLPAPDYSKYNGSSKKHKFHKKYPNNPDAFAKKNDDSKKKYFLTGDPFYQELSLAQIQTLKSKYRKNTRKLKQIGIISKLSNISDEKKYEAWFGRKSQQELDKQNQQIAGQLLLLNYSEPNLSGSENILDGCISVTPIDIDNISEK